MTSLIQYINGDPHVIDADGNARRQGQFFTKTTECTIASDGVLTVFPRMSEARNADPIYMMDTKELFLFDEDTQTGLPQ
jgi:hypothetical protein